MSKIPKKETDVDRIPLSFGKHKGSTPNEILEDDPGYIVWIVEESGMDYKNILTEELYEEALEANQW